MVFPSSGDLPAFVTVLVGQCLFPDYLVAAQSSHPPFLLALLLCLPLDHLSALTAPKKGGDRLISIAPQSEGHRG